MSLNICMCFCCVIVFFVLVILYLLWIHVNYLSIFFGIASLAMCQSNCSGVSQVTMQDKGKFDFYQTTTSHDKASAVMRSSLGYELLPSRHREIPYQSSCLVASLMSPVVSLVTTDRCSNVSMCLWISIKCFFPGIVPLLYSVGNKTYYYYW